MRLWFVATYGAIEMYFDWLIDWLIDWLACTVSLKVHCIVSTWCEKEKTSDGAWMLLSTTAWVSVLSVGDSMHEARRQRTHGHQFAARFLVGRDRRCWRRAVKSVMERWWPAWAGWWYSSAPDQSEPCAQGDTVCTRFVARQEANVTPEGQELHGRVVSGRAQVSPPRAGLSTVVPVSPPRGRQGRRCSSRGATAQGPRPVAQKRRGRVVDEQSVDYSKAFDTINHLTLFQKLRQLTVLYLSMSYSG